MTANVAQFIHALRKLLPKANILTEPEQLKPFECDGLSAYQRLPLLVVLPETVMQVQQILSLCHKSQIPVIARGAGTGLSGGALPREDCVLLSMTKFRRIVNIDAENRMAVVEPGVSNLAVSEAVKDLGLYYAPDPSSQVACSIGGNVAENSGGVHCLKYGLTTHNILRLKVVTMEGELLTLGSHGLDAAGYDVLAVMTGSEGLLGVIVEVTVKLLPIPESKQVLLAAFGQLEAAGHAVAEIIASGLIPAGLELIDKAGIAAVEDFVQAGYPLDAEAVLICEVDGCREQVTHELQHAVKVFQGMQAEQIKVANNDAECQQMWLGRKSAFPAVGRISPDYYCMDGTIPRHELAVVLKNIAELSKKYGLDVVNVFHAGDGNLHPLILYDANEPGSLQKAERLGGEILQLSIRVGGTITGEHGVGMEKIDYMCLQFNNQEINQFQQLKKAFDEQELLNPGKAIPTLHRCAEFGAMHVHAGEMSFPDLPRF